MAVELQETAGMMVAASLLFAGLLGRGRSDLHRMLLVGVIFGTLFRSLLNLVQRLIDPNEFAVLQGASFARFNAVNGELLAVSAALSGLAFALALGLAARARRSGAGARGRDSPGSGP